MVVFYEMTDKQSQQRQGRDDGANRSIADRNAMEEDRALAPETTQAPARWPALDREAPGVGGDSLDPADWCSLAGSAGEISASFNLLAALAGLGGVGGELLQSRSNRRLGLSLDNASAIDNN